MGVYLGLTLLASGMEKFGFGIREKHPGSSTQVPGLFTSAFLRSNALYGHFSMPDLAGVRDEKIRIWDPGETSATLVSVVSLGCISFSSW